MRVAWFRPSPVSALDARITTAFETELSRSQTVDAFDERTAHDFVWKHFRAPYDVCLYEWNHTPRHRFVGAYLFHYPGVLLVHSLVGARHALAVSRLVVMGNSSAAELVLLDVPSERIRVAPQFAAPIAAPASRDPSVSAVGGSLSANRRPALFGRAAARPDVAEADVVRFAVIDAEHIEIAERAMARARTAGAAAALVEPEGDIDRTIYDADVVIALQGPTFAEPLTPALLGMSAGRPVIVSEAEATADWPTLDPQTWLPRGLVGNESPVAVSIDPRDEEHSLMLAIRRLSADASLRAQLGTAARRWWETHATPKHAADSWSRILKDAVSIAPPRASDLPAHLTADGTAFARQVLAEFDISVDVFVRLEGQRGV
jgi:hypothetical protein